MAQHNPTNVILGEVGSSHVQFTFKLTDAVNVNVDWQFTGEVEPGELEREARRRLVEAGLPADLEQEEY